MITQKAGSFTFKYNGTNPIINWTDYERIEYIDENGSSTRYCAMQTSGGLPQGGCAAFEYQPVGRIWKMICAPGEDDAWILEDLYILQDGRLIMECSPKPPPGGWKPENPKSVNIYVLRDR